jgi:hypothetical protein
VTSGCNGQQYKNIKNCKTLEIGMKYNMVVDIMGVPDNVNLFHDNGKELKWLYYDAPLFSSTVPSCLIDVQEDRLIKVFCDDSYQK